MARDRHRDKDRDRGRGGCGTMVKYTFGAINLLIMIGGCVLLGIGISALVGDGSAFSDIISVSMFTGTAILIAVAGSFIVLVSFFGCCGAFRESRCMLATFFCLVLMLFVLTAAGAITGFVMGGDAIVQGLQDAMMTSLQNYVDGEEAAVAAWDTIQQDFECCGVNGWRDYTGLGADLPASCFLDGDDSSPVNQFRSGCLSQAVDFVQSNSSLLGGIAIGVTLFLIAAMASSCVLMRTVD